MPITVTTYPDLQANGYVSLVEARAYWAERLKTHIKTSNDDEVAAAIIVASQYLDTRFRFVGYRKSSEQAREWPRSGAYDDRGDAVGEVVPIAVKHATCEYAFRALTAELMKDPTRDDSGRVVVSKDEKVGPLTEGVKYSEFAGFELPVYPAADRLLTQRGLVVKSAGGISISSIIRG
jgi:hypothetical protein